MISKSFLPTPRTLMGPGPSDVHPRVLSALARPTIGHLDPEFVELMDQIKVLLKSTFKTKNRLTLPLSAPGSAAMEAAFANLIEPGDKVIICVNGVFGGRMAENVRRMGGELVTVEDDWGSAVTPEKLESELKANPGTKVVGFVYAETSTGVKSDAETLCRISREYDCLSIVDAVTALGGIELETDAWNADVVYSGSQKCLSCPPGISLITFSDLAADKIQSRNSPVQSWFLDMSLLMAYWDGEGARTYHHTAPVNAMYGLHESLLILEEEGLEKAWERHRAMHEMLASGLEELGFRFFVEKEEERLPQLNTVKLPPSIEDQKTRNQLLTDYNLEVGAGLGPFSGQVWRIGLMGYSARKENVELCLGAMKACM